MQFLGMVLARGDRHIGEVWTRPAEGGHVKFLCVVAGKEGRGFRTQGEAYAAVSSEMNRHGRSL